MASEVNDKLIDEIHSLISNHFDDHDKNADLIDYVVERIAYEIKIHGHTINWEGKSYTITADNFADIIREINELSRIKEA